RITDLSGNGTDGMICGTPPPAVVPGRLGLARSFAELGRNQVGSSRQLQSFPTRRSSDLFGAWIRVNASETDGGYILSKPWNGNGAYNWQLYITAGNQPQVRLYGNTWWTSPVGTPLVAGQLTHIFVVLGSDKSVKLYRNGVL